MNSSDQQPALIINSVARLLSKKIHRVNKDLMILWSKIHIPTFVPRYRAGDSQILCLLLLALSIANQLDRKHYLERNFINI